MRNAQGAAPGSAVSAAGVHQRRGSFERTATRQRSSGSVPPANGAGPRSRAAPRPARATGSRARSGTGRSAPRQVGKRPARGRASVSPSVYIRMPASGSGPVQTSMSSRSGASPSGMHAAASPTDDAVRQRYRGRVACPAPSQRPSGRMTAHSIAMNCADRPYWRTSSAFAIPQQVGRILGVGAARAQGRTQRTSPGERPRSPFRRRRRSR